MELARCISQWPENVTLYGCEVYGFDEESCFGSIGSGIMDSFFLIFCL